MSARGPFIPIFEGGASSRFSVFLAVFAILLFIATVFFSMLISLPYRMNPSTPFFMVGLGAALLILFSFRTVKFALDLSRQGSSKLQIAGNLTVYFLWSLRIPLGISIGGNVADTAEVGWIVGTAIAFLAPFLLSLFDFLSPSPQRPREEHRRGPIVQRRVDILKKSQIDIELDEKGGRIKAKSQTAVRKETHGSLEENQ